MKSVNGFYVLWWENHTINSLPALNTDLTNINWSSDQDLHNKLMCVEIKM